MVELYFIYAFVCMYVQHSHLPHEIKPRQLLLVECLGQCGDGHPPVRKKVEKGN
jgi:hypothetical protein